MAVRDATDFGVALALLIWASASRTVTRLALGGGALLPIVLFHARERAVTVVSFRRRPRTTRWRTGLAAFSLRIRAGIGCRHEHGTYVADVLPHGLDAKAAALILLRRLRLHFIDIANFEPLALFVLAAPWLARRQVPSGDRPSTPPPRVDAARTLALAVAVLSIFLVYVPFYFDGSYAGGGARLFADVLPLEHVLIATALALLVDRVRARVPWIDLSLASAVFGGLSVVGFGVHAAFEHSMLRDREGGRPFFEPSVLTEAKVDRGLLFVGTDHAFNLAYDPGARDAEQSLVVAREFGDDRDRLLWERLGRPLAHRYVFEGRADAKPAVVAWTPGPPPRPYRFEAEAEWPPIRQQGGSFEPVFAQGTCAWGARLLAVNSEPDRPFDGAISFPVPGRGTFRLGVHVAAAGDVTSRIVLRAGPGAPPLATWTFASNRQDFNCATLTEEFVNLADRGWLEVTARGGSKLFLDAVALEPVAPIADAH